MGGGVGGATKPKLESRVVLFKSSPRLSPLVHLHGAALQARLTNNKILYFIWRQNYDSNNDTMTVTNVKKDVTIIEQKKPVQ